MAIRRFNLAARPGGAKVVDQRADGVTSQLSSLETAIDAIDTAIDAAEASEVAAVTSAVAAAQAIGAGDASAEIDAIDTAHQALVAAIAAVQTTETTAAVAAFDAVVDPSTTGSIIILIDNSVVTTRTQIREAMEAFLRQLEGSSEFSA